MINRRGLLAGILAAGFAPAFVGSSVLMPVRKITRAATLAAYSRAYSPGLDDLLYLLEHTNDILDGMVWQPAGSSEIVVRL